MQVKDIDSWVMGAVWRRFAGVAACFWIAGVVAIALWSAIDNGVELYSRTMLGLLIIGVPVALICFAYAVRLIGKAMLIWVVALVLVGAVALMVMSYLQRRHDGQYMEQRRADADSAKSFSIEDMNSAFEQMQEERRHKLRDSGFSEKTIDSVVPKPLPKQANGPSSEKPATSP